MAGRRAFLTLVAMLAGLDGHAVAMGSGPHLHVAYGIPATPVSGSSVDGLIVAGAFIVFLVVIVGWAFRREGAGRHE